ncbi:MFS transporter [Novosphingobium sp.]|uniref:MFS transporter n=1 Tax=Novosphingobium sp. TaxID=1874826 RepID=UPI0026373CD8|nr:MFS transporter [Novosphingobium sp.]
MAEPAPDRLSLRVLLLYTLAWSGGAIAYVPFLTILLPMQVTVLAGDRIAVSWLAYILFAGAVAASLGNILFGYLSDRSGHRLGWVTLGLGISGALLLLMAHATSFATIIVLVIAWQLGLNMMLAPLAAWAGEQVPDRQKGLLGGLLAFAPGMGGLASAVVTLPGLAAAGERLVLVMVMVTACVIPLLLLGPSRRLPATGSVPPDAGSSSPAPGIQPERAARARLARRMWLARLAVQIAEAALFSFLYLWLRRIDPTMDDFRTARVLSLVLLAAAPIALLAGHWGDRRNRPIAPLMACALVASIALLAMAAARSLIAAYVAYAVFGCATSTFLALHSAQTLRVLPRTDRIGRDLGLFNLTNTVPSLVMPWLTLALVPYFGFSGLFVLLALLSLCAAGLLGSLRFDR